MFGSIGFPEVIMIFIVVMLLFGPKKLPDFAKLLGKTIRDFKNTVNEARAAIEEEIENVDLAKDLKDIEKDIKEIVDVKNIDIAKDLKEINGNIKEKTKTKDG